ncbi:MAG: peptidoglycan-binding protein [Chthoniobacterales bacterium]
MKRILSLVAALVICGIASATADDNIRAAQARLKEGGFFFGETNGQYNSETAAAVSRYQIRNGLQITGQLDAATAKALGVSPASSASAAPAGGAEAWQRLRKPDQQFLQRQSAPPAPAKAKLRPVPAQPPVREAAPPPADATTFVLSRERLRDWVAAFVLAGLDPHVGAELDFFGDRVNYFDSGVVGQERIRHDLQAYDAKWPQRSFRLAGEVNVQPQPDSRIRVTFPLRFELRKGSRHSAGKVQKTLLLEVIGDDLRIVAVNEARAR